MVDAKLQDGDITRAVRILSSEDTLVKTYEDTLNLLLDKHTVAEGGCQFPPHPKLPSNLVDVTTNEIFGAFKGFPNEAAGEYDALRPLHLKVC